MDVSKFLAKVTGTYLIFISLTMLMRMHQFINSVTSLIHNAPVMFSLGFICLILGILMLVSHNIWQWNWKVIITLIAWATFLKGAVLIFSPNLMDEITISFLKNIKIAYIYAAFDLTIGILLTYFGFKK